MAVYKVRVPTGVRSYKVSMPTGVRRYKVSFPSGGGGGGTGTIEIHMDIPAEAPVGATWTLRDSLGIVATGGATTPPIPYQPEDYTLTWEDTAFPWVPPGPEGPTTLIAGGAIEFGPPA